MHLAVDWHLRFEVFVALTSWLPSMAFQNPVCMMEILLCSENPETSNNLRKDETRKAKSVAAVKDERSSRHHTAVYTLTTVDPKPATATYRIVVRARSGN